MGISLEQAIKFGQFQRSEFLVLTNPSNRQIRKNLNVAFPGLFCMIKLLKCMEKFRSLHGKELIPRKLGSDPNGTILCFKLLNWQYKLALGRFFFKEVCLHHCGFIPKKKNFDDACTRKNYSERYNAHPSGSTHTWWNLEYIFGHGALPHFHPIMG